MRTDWVITNHGTIRLASGPAAVYERLTGDGCLVNAGRCEVYSAGVGGGARSRIPMVVPPSGQLTLNSNTYLWLGGNSCLFNAGSVEVQAGATLEMTDITARDFVLYAKSRLTGGGVTTIGGNNRLLILGNATLADGALRLTGTSTMAGYGRLLVATGATFWTDHSVTFPGTLDVDGTMTLSHAAITAQVNAALTLSTLGTLNNPGTVRAGFFLNLGGIIHGNTPVLIGVAGAPQIDFAPGWLRIDGVALETTNAGVASKRSATDADVTIVLFWPGPPGLTFEVEMSNDLTGWSVAPADIQETAPGLYRGKVPSRSESAHYFRLRHRSIP